MYNFFIIVTSETMLTELKKKRFNRNNIKVEKNTS